MSFIIKLARTSERPNPLRKRTERNAATGTPREPTKSHAFDRAGRAAALEVALTKVEVWHQWEHPDRPSDTNPMVLT